VKEPFMRGPQPAKTLVLGMICMRGNVARVSSEGIGAGVVAFSVFMVWSFL